MRKNNNASSVAKLVYLGSLCGLIYSLPSYSEEAAVENQAQRSSMLEEVVVTARKREESLQDTPVSVTALTSDRLAYASISSFNKMNGQIPNLELNNGRPDGGAGTAQIFIRGVGQEDSFFPNEPGVGVYVDGVYYARSSAGNTGLMNIERIEVLRGPQGTLYGKNTIGGAVKIVTRKPQGDDAGNVTLTVGDYDRMDFSGWYDFEITDNLFASISGQSLKRDGFVKAVFTCRDTTQTRSECQYLGDENKQAAQFQLRYLPDDQTDIVVRLDSSSQRQNAPAGAMRAYHETDLIDGVYNPNVAPSVAERFNLTGPWATFGPHYVNRIDETENFVSYTAAQTYDGNDVFGGSITVETVWGGLDVKSITAMRHNDIQTLNQADFTPFQLIDIAYEEDYTQLSQEFQINGVAFNDRLTYVAGFFYMDEDGTSQMIAPLAPGVNEFIGTDISQLLNAELKAKSLAVYTEGSYDITEDLAVTLGLRLNRDEKDFNYGMQAYYYSLENPDQPPQYFSGPWMKSESWNELLPKLAVEYHWSADTLLYFTVSKGYKAGGWNPRQSNQLLPNFDPEYVTSYEIGEKTTFFDNRLRFNSALFFVDYEDIQLTQVTTGIINGQSVVTTAVLNGGTAEVMGGEFEIEALPIPTWRLSLNIGLTDAQYTDLDAGVVASGVTEDNEFIQTPKRSLNISSNYTWELGNGYEINWYIDFSYKSKIYRSVENYDELVTDPHWMGNTSLTLRTPSGLEVTAGVTNLTDKIILQSGVDVRGFGFTEGFYNRPRELYLSVRKDF